jgi:RNA polymerase sigma-70 factor (ECF subfamily)
MESKNKKDQFSMLLEAYLSSLYSTALRMTGNEKTARTLIQETILTGYHLYQQDARVADFKVWIFRLLVQTLMEQFQGKMDASQESYEEEVEAFYLYKRFEEIEEFYTGNKDAFMQMFDTEDVKAALEKIPYQFRLVVLLNDINGFTYQEIAHIVDSSPKEVISRLLLGRRLMQRYLWQYAVKRHAILVS